MNEWEQRITNRLRTNTYMHHNFIELESAERDYACFKIEIRPESRNVYGVVHGGALFSLADNATGAAAHTDGRSYVTQNGTLHFLSNQKEGVIRAEARVRRRGKTTCLVSVDITGEDGKLLATGEYSYFCIGKE